MRSCCSTGRVPGVLHPGGAAGGAPGTRGADDSGLTLRQADGADTDRIMALLEEGRASLAGLGIDQWQGEYPHRRAIEADIANGESYLVVDGSGTALATAMIGAYDEPDYRVIEEGDWLTAPGNTPPWYVVVHRVATAQTATKRGAASLVLASALGIARGQGCLSVRIDTHPRNAPMSRLLEKCGFTRCGMVRISHAEGTTPERIAYERLV